MRNKKSVVQKHGPNLIIKRFKTAQILQKKDKGEVLDSLS